MILLVAILLTAPGLVELAGLAAGASSSSLSSSVAVVFFGGSSGFGYTFGSSLGGAYYGAGGSYFFSLQSLNLHFK